LNRHEQKANNKQHDIAKHHPIVTELFAKRRIFLPLAMHRSSQQQSSLYP
jgi:hypothetical protein